MSINIRPLGDRVIVEPVENEETFAGGAFVLVTAHLLLIIDLLFLGFLDFFNV